MRMLKKQPSLPCKFNICFLHVAALWCGNRISLLNKECEFNGTRIHVMGIHNMSTHTTLYQCQSKIDSTFLSKITKYIRIYWRRLRIHKIARP